MKGLTEEEIREIILPLMFSGAKMLDRHCLKCGSPLFEKDGRVFCPVCEHRARQGAGRMRGMEETLMEKLNELASSLPDEVNELEKHLSVMERIIDLITKYRKMEGGK